MRRVGDGGFMRRMRRMGRMGGFMRRMGGFMRRVRRMGGFMKRVGGVFLRIISTLIFLHWLLLIKDHFSKPALSCLKQKIITNLTS